MKVEIGVARVMVRVGGEVQFFFLYYVNEANMPC